jgi:2-methylthioadenine synthetase
VIAIDRRSGLTEDYLSVDISGSGAARRSRFSATLSLVDAKTHSYAANTGMTEATRPTVYIETYGCQMNVSDSELMLGKMAASGYDEVHAPESLTSFL